MRRHMVPGIGVGLLVSLGEGLALMLEALENCEAN